MREASTKIFEVAVNALETHPDLKKVIIVDRAPRIDTAVSDPYGLKSQLSELGNKVFRDLHEKSSFKDKIKIGNHSLDHISKAELFGKPDQQRFDGIHLAGKSGRYHYTESLCNILQKAEIIPRRSFQREGNEREKITCSQPDKSSCQKTKDIRSDDFHYQRRKGWTPRAQNQNQPRESARSENRFDTLSNSGN